MEYYIKNNENDITYMSELTRHESWRVKFAQTTYVRYCSVSCGLI
jgi:hypothetical protein